MLVDLEDLHDVGVLQLGNGPYFDLEAMAILRVGRGAPQDHFDGDRPLEFEVLGLVDHAHAAPTEFFLDDISFKLRGGTRDSGRSGRDQVARDRLGRLRAWSGDMRAGLHVVSDHSNRLGGSAAVRANVIGAIRPLPLMSARTFME
jgi:hypothetical protein